MNNDMIQAEYEQLIAIAKRFSQHAEDIKTMYDGLRGKMQNLHEGGWQGRGSQAFFAEMNELTLPGVTRLQSALAEASSVMSQVVQTIQQAEEEAANLFQGSHDGGVGTDAGIGDVYDGGATPPPVGQTYTPKDPRQIFNETYMENFIGSHFQGENSAELNQLLEDLHRVDPNNTAEVNRLLDRIADIRGVDRATFHAQYQRFLELKQKAFEIKDDSPYIDLNRHGDFLGTTVSLRYGAVVGDALGIDPVFGSLLNPTGGLVGPGNDSYQPSANDAIGYHGVFHDAAGYLYNYQGKIGPGYDYLAWDPSKAEDMYAGQVSGISWWMSHSQLDMDIPLKNNTLDIPHVPRFLEPAVWTIVNKPGDAVIRVVSSGYEGGSDVVDGVKDIFSGDFREGFGDVGSGMGTVVKGIGRSVIDIFD